VRKIWRVEKPALLWASLLTEAQSINQFSIRNSCKTVNANWTGGLILLVLVFDLNHWVLNDWEFHSDYGARSLFIKKSSAEPNRSDSETPSMRR